jgi:translocation and assembly module TamB
LDLSAVKTVNEITAGVRVQGRAQAPELSLFSNPGMSDQDVLSVLIFGKPVSNLASQDSLTLLKIAASLRGNGLDQFSRMTSKLQDMLGLSSLELRLTGDAPEVVAGKQLSSRFYIGYGYGLLDAVQSLVLRYKLSEAWSIQGDFGADSGADLRYQLER